VGSSILPVGPIHREHPAAFGFGKFGDHQPGDLVKGHREVEEEVLEPSIEALVLQVARGFRRALGEVDGAVAHDRNDEVPKAFEAGVFPRREGGAETVNERGI